MAQIVKLRRSSVSGQKPTNSNLQLGELALNTTDGKVYMAKSGSLGPTVEELISTNTVNTGSIHLVGNVTASNFTGSFTGDGTNLYNIPASGVTGLNLTMIADGNATASISNTDGLKINTNTEITGSLIVSSGSAVFDASLQLTENSSLILNSGSNLYVYDGGIISGTFKGNGALLTDLPYATTASNQFFGDQTITGSVVITQNLTVLGSSSISYITSSQLDVATSFISVNVFEPAERFGGIKVYDSGSSNATASLAWDSLQNHWVYQNASGSSYSGGMLLAGPRNTGSLGDEVGLINGRIAKSVGGDHLDNSIMSETGTTINIDGNLNASSLTGSIDFENLTNVPTLVSGSSQIEITGTTGYSTFSSSVSTSIGELSSSVATTTNNLDGRLDSIEGVTGSYATTGSNQFNGNQSISGSVNIGSGSLDPTSPEVLHVGNSGSYNIARFDGYDNDYAQVNIKNHHSGSGASGDFVITADNGDETIHYVNLGINSSNYNAGYVGLENDAYLLNAGKDLYVGTIGGSGHPSNLNLFAQNKWETPQIHVSGSGQVLFNTLTIASGYEYEFSGSINANHDLNVDGNISGSNITGSFIGDGSGLYNIPSSGVTGLELNKIVSGSVSASISPDNGLQINTDVVIDGTLTAKELYINYVTSSVLYESGSTKFGDTNDDTHQFTGSVYVEGNLNVNSITGSIDFTNLTNVPTLVSGSPQISYTGITDVPNGIVSGSNQISFNGITDKPTLVSGSSQISYTGITDTPSGIVSGSSQISYTGITDTPSGIVSGSSQISYTGITDTPSGIVSGSQQVSDLGFVTTGSFETFTSSYTTDSSSFDSRINVITGSIETFNSVIDSIQLYTSSLDNYTSSLVLNSQTSSMSVLSSSYALTASYALNGGGGGTEGRTAKLDQTTPNTTWTFNHNLGEQYPSITIFDSLDNVVIPSTINAQDGNTLIITFSSPQSGTATATIGGGLPYISSSFDGYVLSVDDNAPTWKGGIISGSQQITNFGFATTGSNTFYGNQTISGTTTIGVATMGSKCVTISSNTAIFDLGTFDGANFDYVVKNGNNMRAGLIMSAWNGTNSVYNESSTMDLGSTTDVTFSVSSAGVLNANISSGTWAVEVLYRALGCSEITPPTPTPTPTVTSTPTPTPTSTGCTVGMLINIYGGSDVTDVCSNVMTPSNNPYVCLNFNENSFDIGRVWYTSINLTTPYPAGYYKDYYDPTWVRLDSSGTIVETGECVTTSYQISSGSTAPDYCSGLFGQSQTVYGNASDWLEITRFYTSSGFAAPFNGNNKYYGNSTADYGTTLQIDESGYVINSYAC